MKNVLLLTCVCVVMTMGAGTAGAGLYDARYVLQGDSVEFRIPKYDLTAVEGIFEGKTVRFYEIEDEPKFDEEISRAEFLELLFKNYDFGDVDVSGVDNFPDVSETNPYYEYVKKAAALGIIHGYQDGFFRPYTTITRGQAAKILVEAFEPEEILSETKVFSDVPNGHVFYDHIARAIRAELFRGYPDGLMRPDREINFSEAEIVIERVAKPENLVKLDERKYLRGFLGIHRLSSLGVKTLRLKLSEGENSEVKNVDINLGYRNFPVISFSLAPSKTALFADEDQDKTWSMIDSAKSSSESSQLWEGNFVMPTVGELTLGFGDKLYINGAYSGSHFGHDYANVEGTEIVASNKGKVVLSDYTPSYGNTVVIDHGHNIFTMYLHMSELKINEGEMVNKGDLIGLMGSTGIATGSHLHFTMFIGDIIVDSTDWIEGEF